MRAVVLIAVLLAGCSTLPPECKTDYAHTLSHCPRPLPRPPKNEAECKQAGGVTVIKDGRFVDCVSPEALRHFMQGRP